jgi:hypothetical protein
MKKIWFTTYPNTNFQRGILAHDVSIQSKTVYDLMFYKNKYFIKVSPQERNIEEASKQLKLFRICLG